MLDDWQTRSYRESMKLLQIAHAVTTLALGVGLVYLGVLVLAEILS